MPSTNDLEDNSRLEFVKKWRKVAKKIDAVRKKYPPIYKGGFWVTASFDGSSCPPWWYDDYEYPAEPRVRTILEQFRAKVGKDLFGIPQIYKGLDLCDLEGPKEPK